MCAHIAALKIFKFFIIYNKKWKEFKILLKMVTTIVLKIQKILYYYLPTVHEKYVVDNSLSINTNKG